MSRTEAGDRAAHSLSSLSRDARLAAAVLGLLSLFVLFHNLGGAALFDPDEGRNAEIAREIPLTKDWVTPYYDFLPRLEKPMFFYALTALCYKLFGVSEAAARFPSAALALATFLLTYFFARRTLGSWAALWSGLILVTCVEFYAFSRIVILDMTLAFFLTLALCAYYRASAAESREKKRAHYFLMYAAVACATLVKGPIGFVFPGMIILSYLVVKRKWSGLAEMELGWGVLIFVLIAAPWYAWQELRNPGYLAYFLGQEHFARYLTPYYHRTKTWYFFFVVLAGGFFPWTLLLPSVATRLWKKPLDDLSLYLLLWAIVPFVFFSLSRSKMAEYLLPIYPALSILAGKSAANSLKTWEVWLLSLTWQVLNLSLLYLVLGLAWPEILPVQLRAAVRQLSETTAPFAALLLLAFVLLPWTAWMTFARDQQRLLFTSCLVFFLFFAFAHRFIEPFSLTRSYKDLAARSAPFLRPGDQLVIYDNFMPSLPFYLGVSEPIWIVTSADEDNIMGSFYLAEQRPPPAPGHGKVLFTHEEFFEQWGGRQRRLLVFIKEKYLFELRDPKVLLRLGGIALVANR